MLTTLQIAIVFLILASAFPIGYLLAWLCREELKQGRKWFRGISILCVAAVWSLVLFWNSLAVVSTLCSIGIVSAISFLKSGDKRWTKS